MSNSNKYFWALLAYSLLTGKKWLTNILVGLLVVALVACAIVFVFAVYYAYLLS